MSNEQLIYLGLVLCGFVVCFLLTFFISRKVVGKCDHDERQEIARGRAYKYAYFTMLFGVAIIVCTGQFTKAVFSLGIQIGFLLFASITVYSVYCIANDAYFGISQKKNTFLILDIIICVTQLVGFVPTAIEGDFNLADDIPNGIMNFFCFLTFFVIGTAIVIKTIIDKKAGELDEES